MASYDPRGVPVARPTEPAGCPVNNAAFSGAKSLPIPWLNIARGVIGAIPFLGPTITQLAFRPPDNAAALVEARENLESQITQTLAASITASQDIYCATVALMQLTLGSGGSPGYVATLAERAAQSLNQQLTMIVVNCAFLFVMLIAIVWTL